MNTQDYYRRLLATGANMRDKLALRTDDAAEFWREHLTREIRRLELQRATETSEVKS